MFVSDTSAIELELRTHDLKIQGLRLVDNLTLVLWRCGRSVAFLQMWTHDQIQLVQVVTLSPIVLGQSNQKLFHCFNSLQPSHDQSLGQPIYYYHTSIVLNATYKIHVGSSLTDSVSAF